jgi:uncharacterized protein YybS (DUF2232 family)
MYIGIYVHNHPTTAVVTIRILALLNAIIFKSTYLPTRIEENIFVSNLTWQFGDFVIFYNAGIVTQDYRIGSK